MASTRSCTALAASLTSARVGRGSLTHRLEHLGGDDHRDAERAGPARDLLLHPRHAFERQLEPEIAARHHHRVGLAQDLLDVRDRFRPFQLGYERDVRGAGVAQRLARLAHVGGGLHEAQGDEIDALAGRRTRGPRRPSASTRPTAASTPGALMPLCSPSSPPSTTVVLRPLTVRVLHPQLDPPVVEQQRVAAVHRLGQIGVGGGDPAGLALEVAGLDHQRSSPAFSGSGFPPLSGPVRIFGPLRSCRRATQRRASAAAWRTRAMAWAWLCVRAVREIKPEDVDAGGDQLANAGFAARRGAEGGDDLGLAHAGMLQGRFGGRPASVQPASVQPASRPWVFGYRPASVSRT